MGTADFMENADNVYRTDDFIVKQVIGLQHDEQTNNVIYSHDTYYNRTPSRDKAYEKIFASRHNIDGKRLPSNMYSRRYVD